MAEWSNAAVLKTVVPQGTGGSNPSRSVFWKRGRAVIRRIANPWVPIWARQVRLLSLPFYKLLLVHEIVAQLD